MEIAISHLMNYYRLFMEGQTEVPTSGIKWLIYDFYYTSIITDNRQAYIALQCSCSYKTPGISSVETQQCLQEHVGDCCGE